ncbi:phenoloxidase-activating factor 3-like [Sabethes cyaneus]|uniref:phenoloxidase-activating factor 3-like n=1 Tax=Sabethes cyaneus TaxID=53552 RepID=UPI00237E5333|nr:phenoloxidase-activating factor 3-like [Sabethes cyaneus]XP_053693704.1 phenoloxidase-activating factor 3-like [Sabethes cyaneus]
MQCKTDRQAAMRIATLLSLFAGTLAAQLKMCSFNELCVPIQNCSLYKPYASGTNYRDWPKELQKKATSNLCNNEKINNTPVLSVCCPTPLNSKQCGLQSSNKISKGKIAQVYEYPWMVLLEDSKNDFVCGGTLISQRYVLTAAHCLKSAKIISVRVGELDLTSPIDCLIIEEEMECAPPPQDIKVVNITRHPLHSERGKKNDIALLRLERPVEFSNSVKPICLPNGTPEDRMINPAFFIVSGWGLTENGTSFDVLRYARVPPVSLDTCATSVRQLSVALRLDQSQICAGGVDAVDNCAGDSGGPLQYVSNRTTRFYQLGVVSYGLRSCGIQSQPGVYTNVLYYLNWIMENVDE